MLSIIVPIWNPTEGVSRIVGAAMKRLRECTPDAEIILINNLSPHWGIDVKSLDPTLWNFPENAGIAKAWNKGAELAKHDVLCWLNSDCFVTRGWAEPLMECARAGLNVAMPLTNGEKPYNGLGITGWCFMATRETYDNVGPFDESFSPCFYEDTDWFHRLLEIDGTLWSVPASNVEHEHRTSAKHMDFSDWIFMSNRFRYAWKHKLEEPMNPPPFWLRPIPDWTAKNE